MALQSPDLYLNRIKAKQLPYFLLSSSTVVTQQATPMCGSVVLAEAEKEEVKGAGSSTVLLDTELACLVLEEGGEETCLVLEGREDETCWVPGVREEATCLMLGRPEEERGLSGNLSNCPLVASSSLIINSESLPPSSSHTNLCRFRRIRL
jgi:hypothetical protein